MPTRFLARSHLRDSGGQALLRRNQPGSCQQSTPTHTSATALSLLRTPLAHTLYAANQSYNAITHLPTFRGPHYRPSLIFASHLSHRSPCSLTLPPSTSTSCLYLAPTLLRYYIVINVNHSHGSIYRILFPFQINLNCGFCMLQPVRRASILSPAFLA